MCRQNEAFSPSSDIEASPSSEPLRKVAKLVDDYIAEVASDVNLKADKFRALAEALPEDSRFFHDGLYRALDVYFKVCFCIFLHFFLVGCKGESYRSTILNKGGSEHVQHVRPHRAPENRGSQY